MEDSLVTKGRGRVRKTISKRIITDLEIQWNIVALSNSCSELHLVGKGLVVVALSVTK